MKEASGKQPGLAAELRSPLRQLQFLVVIALLLGGGGSAFGMRNLAVQLVALAILAFNGPAIMRFFGTAPRILLLLVSLSLLLPLAQLVPLPPHVWGGLAGRDLLAESLTLAGGDTASWQPISLNPVRTILAFTATIVPAVVIMLGTSLPRADKQALAVTVIFAALAAFLLGAIQLASGNAVMMFFTERTLPDVLYATFANRNSTAIFFVLALCVMAGLPAARSQMWSMASIAIAILLAVGTILTQSRSGITLLVLPVALFVLRLAVDTWRSRKKQTASVGPIIWSAAAAAGLLVVAVGVSATMGGRAADSFSRFAEMEGSDRPEMWEDGIYAADQYWPAGAGTGAFDDVFQIHESLEFVSPRRAGRAHNDYIEMAIEGGLLTLVLAAAWIVWAGFASLRPGPQEDWWTRLGAGAGLAALALQSLLDYPLRNQTILCAAAVLVVLLATPRAARLVRGKFAFGATAGAAVFAALLALLAIPAQLDRQSMEDPSYAPLVPSAFAANASLARSQLALAAAQPDKALEEARRLVRLRPMPATSLSTLAAAAAAAGDEDLAVEALGAASRRGWRDPLVQLTSGESALRQGEYQIAAQRTAALIATGDFRELALDLLGRLVATPEGRTAFAERMAQFGRWQDNTIVSAADVAAPMDWAMTLAEARSQGAELDCGRLRRLAEMYRRRGEGAAADLFWPGSCAGN